MDEGDMVHVQNCSLGMMTWVPAFLRRRSERERESTRTGVSGVLADRLDANLLKNRGASGRNTCPGPPFMSA